MRKYQYSVSCQGKGSQYDMSLNPEEYISLLEILRKLKFVFVLSKGRKGKTNRKVGLNCDIRYEVMCTKKVVQTILTNNRHQSYGFG